MGANAQTTVPTFTAGQVLTADQQNQSARTGVPVFATTVERDAAFGGTGEKTLAEGQLCYLEDSDVVQYYDGSSWATVGPQTVTTPGLVRLSGETAFSAASSVTLDSVFTSTYRNYKIIINYTTSSTSGMRFRVRASGSSVSTTTYNEQQFEASNTTLTGSRGASGTSVIIAGATNGSFNASIELALFNIQVATPTTLISMNIHNSGAYTVPISGYYTGNNSNATSYDGFELFTGSGTMTGNYTVYGLATS